MKKSLCLFLAAGLAAVSAQATDYYVDPSSGDMANPGTSGSPWSTLQAVFSAGKTFSSGDVIYLRDGNHGAPTVAGNNGGNVTITAQSGHDPELASLVFNNASNWTASGLSISREHGSGNSELVETEANCSNITIDNCDIFFTSSVTGGYNLNGLGVAVRIRGDNTTFTNNYVYNTRFAIVVTEDSSNSVVRNNDIEGIMEDGMRILGDYTIVEYNYIHDWYGVDAAHDDGIQGWAVNGTVYGVELRGNLIVNQTTTTSPYPDTYGVQGIGLFDGWFEDWVVENNVVITDMWHGISFYGARDCTMVNNTVVRNPNPLFNRNPWITFRDHKNGQASTGNICRNNFASSITTLSGTTSSNNVESTAYSTYFVDYNNFDLHLKAGSPAINAGTTTDAPSIDFEQNARTAPYDIGAFEYSSGGGSDTTAPSTPTGLASSNITATAVDLDWNASTDNVGVAGYYIYTGGSNPVSISGTSATVVGLSPSTNYTFTVSAYDAAANESSQSSGVNVTTQSAGSSTISEDFSSGASNFTVELGGTWSVSSGRYVLSSPATPSTTGVLANISVHNTSLIGDFELSATMRITGTSNVWNDATVLFGYQDEDNYYYLSLNESNDGYTKGLFKVVDGTPTELADIGISVVSDTDYNIGVTRSGSSIAALVNSSLVASASDSTFTTGQVGFGSFNDGAQFDNLIVTGGTIGSDVDAPTVPTGLSGSNLVSNSIDLSWNASTDNVGVTGYKVYTNGSSPVSVSGTSTTISGLSVGTSYTFTVSAVDAAANESSQSSGFTLNRVTSVSVTPATLALSVSGSSYLTATVSPGNAFDSGVSWSTSNAGVATVSSGGLVTGVSAGSATITATTDDGSYTDTCAVTVSSGGGGGTRYVDVDAETDDQEIYDTGGAKWVGEAEMRVGGSTSTTDSCGVFPFELPELDPGETITDATFSVHLISIANTPSGNVDLYGLGYRSTSGVNTSDYYEGSYDGDGTDATAIDNAIATPSSSNDTILSTDSTGSSNLVDYLNAQYTAGAEGGDYVFLRVSPSNSNESNYEYWKFSTANAADSADRPVLSLEISGGGSSDTEAPSAPTGLAASNLTSTSIDLSWSASSDNVGVTGYKVYTDGSNPVSVSGTSTTISGLSVGTDYTFTVSAVDAAANESSQSSGYDLIRVTGVSVAPTSLNMVVSATSDLTETVSPSNAFDSGVTWSSSDTNVATVNSSGLVTAVAVGEATITVTTDDGSFTANCMVEVSTPTVRYVDITAETNDQEIYDTGGAKWVGQSDMRVGGSSASVDSCGVFPFQLPTLAAGETITEASFSVHLISVSNTPSGNVDLYGLGYRGTSGVNSSDYYEGSYDGDGTDATAIDNAIATPSSSNDTILSTDSTGESNLVAYLNAQYTAGAQGGDYVFLRVSPSNANETDYEYWKLSTANASEPTERPMLSLEISE